MLAEKALDSVKVEKSQENGKAFDFEEAISASGFGKFNILLLLCALPGFMTAVYVTSSLSFVITSAECDLGLNVTDMGTLNIVTYTGMLMSALMWGFLSDTLGRKKIMVWGFLGLALCEVFASQSQNYWMLVMFKFLAGFIFNGPFAVLISYLSELHSSSLRAKVLLYIGIFYGFANINLPLLAWSVIPNEWNLSLFGGFYELHSWHVFLLLTTIPPLASGLGFAMMPESPKFLMSRGRNDEALEVFRIIYASNSGMPPETYPIKRLIDETSGRGESPRGLAALKAGVSQLKPLCLPPHVFNLLLVCFINSITMLGGNTLRLWFPQMATIVEDYNSKNAEGTRMCSIIDSHIYNKTFTVEAYVEDCVKLETGAETYVNSMIIGAGTLVTYILGGLLINSLGKRKLSSIGLILASFTAMALYWSTNLLEIVSLFTIFVSASSLSGSALSSVIVDLFPTSIRAMAVAVFLMLGRLGTVTGGIAFPYLLSLGCLAPFVFISSLMLVTSLLCYVIPNTTMKKLE